MPAEGFLWALRAGYALYLYDWFKMFVPVVWDMVKNQFDIVLRTLREAGIDV